MRVGTFIGLATGGIFVLVCFGAAIAAGQAIKYKRLDDQHQACVEAVKAGAAGLLVVGKKCDAAINAAQVAAQQVAACDQALSAKPENTFGVRTSCSTPAKTVIAQRDAARSERDAAQDEAASLRAGQAAAIARAEARVNTQAQRKVDAALALSRAPRDGDGLLVCDAGCLRQRSGLGH